MGNLALGWSIAAIAALVAAVSAVRLTTTSGESRFAASGDLLMGLCMAAMALPSTAAWYAGYGMWWAAAFAALGLWGAVLAVKNTREYGWKRGRHWVHLIVGSSGMVIMTLAMTSTPSGPVLALGHGSAAGRMAGMEDMAGMESMPGMEVPGMSAHAATAGADAPSPSVLRLVIAALAVYFLLSIAASVWAHVRGKGSLAGHRECGQRRSWGRWLLTMPDTVVVFLASLTILVWDRARAAEGGRHSRRRRLGATPEAALAAHIGMGGTMSAMLLMMAA